MENKSIELTGTDRPGLLSKIFAVLTDLECNVVVAEIWTHNSRMASVIYITDQSTGKPLRDGARVGKLKQLLRHILRSDGNRRKAATTVAAESALTTHPERRLHQMMYADRDFIRDNEEEKEEDGSEQPFVTSSPLPSAILSPRRDFFRLGSEWRLFLFCHVLTWQRRGFRVRSTAVVASTSLPALRDRSVGVQPPLLVKHWGGGDCFQTLGWKVDKTQTLGVSGLLPLL